MRPFTFHASTVVTIALLSACMSGDVRLLQDDWRSEERLRRMDIVVEELNGSNWVIDPDRVNVVQVVEEVRHHCYVVLGETPAFGGCGNTWGCSEIVCGAQIELCRALTFRQMAEGVDTVELEVTPRLRLRPQDAESNVALWQASQYAAMKALEHAAEGLTGSMCEDEFATPFQGGMGPPLAPTGELLASTLVEALNVGEYAADQGARAAIGLADRDRASISDLGAAARLSWFDENLSRLIAVQSQIGGLDPSALSNWEFKATEYLPDTTNTYHRRSIAETGIGSQPACTGSCQVALQTIRFSGAPFTQILATDTAMSINTLVTDYIGPGLTARMGPDVYDTGSAADLAHSLNIPPNSFREARAWMQHEAEVFARPTGQPPAPTPSLPPNDDGGPGATEVMFDPTTMAQPTPPPPMHYFTAARAGAFWSGALGTTPVSSGAKGSPVLPMLRPERAYLFDYAHSVAREALATTSLPAEARGVLATITQMAHARRALSVEVCDHPDKTKAGQVRIRVTGLDDPPLAPPAPPEFLLVEGTTDLRCMVDGEIEGMPCVGVRGDPPHALWADVDGRVSRRHAVEWSMNLSPGESWYVIRLRPDRQSGPGAYEAIAGLPTRYVDGKGNPAVMPAGVSAGECTTIPYDFESNEMSEGYFAIDGDATPARACGDFDLNGPLPLEDIIIDDGDPWEDSWSHHLQVAAAAAAHSDLLGQQLLQAGLQMDERAALANESVQELCGVPLNLDALFDGSGSLADLIAPVSCDEATGMACGSGYETYQCIGTLCVLPGVFGAEDSFEREALLECLGLTNTGEAGTVPIVALSDTPLCVWRRIGAPQILCEGSSDGACPFPADLDGATSVGEACGPPPPDQEMVLVTNDADDISSGTVIPGAMLGLIGSVTPTGDLLEVGSNSGFTRAFPIQCEAIRDMRALDPDSTLATPLLNLIRSSFFSYENVRRWAGRIGWRGWPRNFSEITLDQSTWVHPVDGEPLATTGFPFVIEGRRHGAAGTSKWNTSMPMSPTRTPWPCDDYPEVFVPGGLFSETIACANEEERVQFNMRLGRAVATFAALSGTGLGELLMPAYYGTIVSMYETEGLELQDFEENYWRVVFNADFNGQQLNGWIVAPVVSEGAPRVWAAPAPGSSEITFGGPSATWTVSTNQPFGFLNFGHSTTGDNLGRARAIAQILWEGMDGGDLDRTGGSASEAPFFRVIQGLRPNAGESALRPHPNNIFLRSLLRRSDSESLPYLNHGRQWDGASNFNYLSHLFGAFPFDQGGNANRNIAHLFAENTQDGPFITRRDLLDAMC